MIELRPYQSEAIAKIQWSFNEQLEGGDLCVLPTGAGKSIIIAFCAKLLGIDVLILQPSKEILEQNRSKLSQYVEPEEIGTYSASMNEKTIKKYTLATIQSIYKKPEDFAHFDLWLLDEAHELNPKRATGMFTKFISQINKIREAQGKKPIKVIGFTASPYRLMNSYYKESHPNGGYEIIATTMTKLVNRIQPRFWHRIIFNINNHELVEQGYLTPLKYLDASLVEHEDIPLNKSGTEFDMEKFEKKIEAKRYTVIEGVVEALRDHKSALVFCTSVRQAQSMAEALCEALQNPQVATSVSSATKPKDRDDIISGFKSGAIRVVFNVGVLTTGFDHPSLDCIVLARPTRSLALYYQMLGRGVRKAEGKTHCTVIDFTSTVKNMGRIESIRLVKEKMWMLYTETGQWHGRPLFSYKVKEVLPEEPAQLPI